MINLIEDILLSNVMIFLAMGVVMLLVTGWAFRMREFPGYILGWLVGLFFMVVLSVLMPVPDATYIAEDYGRLNFFGLILGSGLGLALGFGVLLLARLGGNGTPDGAGVGRALTVALLVAITLIASYLMLTSTLSTRMSIAVFVLTFGIGALVNYIFSRGMPASSSSLDPRASIRNFRDNYFRND